MKVRFFFRKTGVNYSVERVFHTIYQYFEVEKELVIDKLSVNYVNINPFSVIYNVLFCFKNRSIGINHITGDIHYVSIGLPRKRTILTVHDMVGVFSNKGIKKFLIWLLWYYIPCKLVAQVTCISESTKNDLIKVAKCSETKISVIPNPISNDFKYIPKVFTQTKPVILHIGTRVNKNLERVVFALESINCHLRIIGELDNHQITILHNCKIDYTNVTNLSDQEIVEEYIQCDIVSFPSLFEGFGMPVIEGQMTGRVVLTSNLEPMKSIANGGAFLVDPYDVNSIRNGFLKIITDNRLRDKLIIVGNENVKRFSIETIAHSYSSLYKSMI